MVTSTSRTTLHDCSRRSSTSPRSWFRDEQSADKGTKDEGRNEHHAVEDVPILVHASCDPLDPHARPSDRACHVAHKHRQAARANGVNDARAEGQDHAKATIQTFGAVNVGLALGFASKVAFLSEGQLLAELTSMSSAAAAGFCSS
eukprot:CAMPEP_0175331740 /NCGR_PEP_ID=MMETSP0095-20121207/1404_1 /TAXON_ID=311494 /ORGANISM="Alexandrium monilatum, Strain CCMP3105" /LENGTH=145 /DNA_ID=CAMNT_0016628979 /DNA_START=163 /DNA_END=598 /DNA_ORIENTATION=-